MKITLLISVLSIILLNGCQSALAKEEIKNTLPPEEGTKLRYTELDISSAKSDLSLIQSYPNLSSYDKEFKKKFRDICLISGYEELDGKVLYFEDLFSTEGNPVICSEKLVNQLNLNEAQANLLHSQWMRYLFDTLERWKSRGEASNTNFFKARLDKYEKYKDQIKAVADLEMQLTEIDRKVNDPVIWLMSSSFDEFEDETTKEMTLKGTYKFSLVCSTDKDKKNTLSFGWRVKSPIATPSTSLYFIALVDGSPIKLKASTYSNSYSSGYVLRAGNIEFDKVLDQLLTAEKFKYRIETKKRSHIVDGSLPKADSTTQLKVFIDECS
jgi:hypothetical protein